MSDSSAAQAEPLGAVIYSGDFEIEPVLQGARDRLLAAGRIRVGGIVPVFGGVHRNGRQEMFLEPIDGGDAILITQELGVGAESCALDLDGLTRARSAIGAAIEAQVDLLFVGKFGKQEAAGHGVREEIGAALVAGIPTLVALRDVQVEAWRAFAGDDWAPLDPTVDSVVDWAERAVPAA